MSLEPWERWKRENEKKKTKINMAPEHNKFESSRPSGQNVKSMPVTMPFFFCMFSRGMLIIRVSYLCE